MSDRKNIDRLFQEKFKDFEAAPPEFIWDNIREELEEKKKRRVIPVWMWLSGVASVLIMGVLLGLYFINNNEGNTNPVVIENHDGVNNQDAPLKKLPTDVTPLNDVNADDVYDRSDKPDVINRGIVNGDGKGATLNENFDPAGTINNKSGKGGKTSATSGYNSTAVATKSDSNKSGSTKSNTKRHINESDKGHFSNKNSAVAHHTHRSGKYNAGKAIASGKNGIDYDTVENSVSDATSAKANSAVASENSNANSQQNDLLNPAAIDKDILIPETAVAVTDSVKPENALEKLLKEKEEGKKEENEKALADNIKTNKWNVKPQLAPVFYNSLSQESPIDGQFAGNAKSYENDLSYGVGVNYAVSKKITIRSGVNTLNLNYATQGVEFYASLNKQTSNIAARSNANIVVQNQGSVTPTPNALFASQLPTGTFNGSMLQKTGYVEVPVEMAYALLDKKFGIDVIGGVSTLFLNENNISVVSTQGYSTNVGKAQNLNDIHFSTNIGIGFKYRFFKSFEANFEPMFKYQISTFSRDAGNFKPYFIGLYSGVSFSF
jgi:hypothetical protein